MQTWTFSFPVMSTLHTHTFFFFLRFLVGGFFVLFAVLPVFRFVVVVVVISLISIFSSFFSAVKGQIFILQYLNVFLLPNILKATESEYNRNKGFFYGEMFRFMVMPSSLQRASLVVLSVYIQTLHLSHISSTEVFFSSLLSMQVVFSVFLFEIVWLHYSVVLFVAPLSSLSAGWLAVFNEMILILVKMFHVFFSCLTGLLVQVSFLLHAWKVLMGFNYMFKPH